MKNRNLVTKLAAIGGMVMMAMPMTVLAAVSDTQDVVQTEGDASVTKNTDVLYTQSSTFSVVIPKTIVLDGATKEADYTVNVKGDISSDKQVKVAPVNTFDMKDQAQTGTKKADVTATVTQGVTVWDSAEVCAAAGTTKNGNVSAQALTSGSWKGTFTFDIALEDVV